MLSIEFSNRQTALAVDERRVARAAEAILRDAGFDDAQLSVALVDDPTIHALNRRYLDHDYPTDVLSFVLERDGTHLEGEVVVSSDTALRRAEEFAWPADDELLLYVIHGILHLVGHDDDTPQQRAAMRDFERRYLAAVGVSMSEASLAERDAAPGRSSPEP